MDEFAGEGDQEEVVQSEKPPSDHFINSDSIVERKLSFIDASRCLNTLGKDESGVKITYLKLSASNLRLTDISCVVYFKHLHFIDVSNNLLNLEALQVITELPYVVYIKVESNILESAALQPIPYLQVFILNKNHIVETSDICQPMLNCLELGENLIKSINFNSSNLRKLKELSLHGNQLTDVSGEYPSSMEKLYLNKNNITKLNLNPVLFVNLKILNLRDNNIRKLDGFTDDLSGLEYLNLRNNKINKVRQFRKLKCLPHLKVMIILGNPVYFARPSAEADEEDEEVENDEEKEDDLSSEQEIAPRDTLRVSLLALLPNLTRIDKENVSEEEVKESEGKKSTILEKIFAEDSSDEEGTEVPTTTDFTTDYYTSETDVDGSSRQESSIDKQENEVILSNTNLSDTVRSFREPPIELDTINEDT